METNTRQHLKLTSALQLEREAKSETVLAIIFM
jgi:hypothetical protein